LVVISDYLDSGVQLFGTEYPFLEQGEPFMKPDPKAKPDPKKEDTQIKESEKNALSPKELGEVAGGRLSSDPCEGGQIR
jgi:hypothetical protein